MSEVLWTKKVPEESGFYWARWSKIGADFPVEVDTAGTVWLIGSEVDHKTAGLLFGPRIPYLWEEDEL